MNFLKKKLFVMCVLLIVAFSCNVVNVEARNLTTQEKNDYRRVLRNKDYIGCGIYNAATFVLYDINGDGKKELIVSGPLGMRSAMFSRVYTHVNKKLVHYDFDGEITGVSKKGMRFDQNDYEGAGEVFYDDTRIYVLSKKGKLVKKAECNSVSVFDYTTDKVKGTVKYFKCVRNKLAKISKKNFNKIEKSYKFTSVGFGKKIKPYDVNEVNIKKYIK